MSHYADRSPEELLEALEMAGRHPDLDLIKECLKHPDALMPGLLDLLAASDGGEDWPDGDPRWYRRVHAGKLLLAFAEPDAAPLFADILRDEENDTLIEWFDTDLHALGPSGVPALIEVVQDGDAFTYGRNLSISALGQIAREHPETRKGVVQALRAALPSLTDDGAPDVDLDTVTHDDAWCWANLALALAELHDEESRAHVEALFAHDLLDEMISGDVDDYHAILRGERPPHDYDFDIIEHYDRSAREGQREARRRAEHEREQERRERASKSRPKKKVGRKYKRCCGP